MYDVEEGKKTSKPNVERIGWVDHTKLLSYIIKISLLSPLFYFSYYPVVFLSHALHVKVILLMRCR